MSGLYSQNLLYIYMKNNFLIKDFWSEILLSILFHEKRGCMLRAVAFYKGFFF